MLRWIQSVKYTNIFVKSMVLIILLGSPLLWVGQNQARAWSEGMIELNLHGFGYYIASKCYSNSGRSVGRWSRTGWKGSRTCDTYGNRTAAYMRVQRQNIWMRDYGRPWRVYREYHQCAPAQKLCINILATGVGSAYYRAYCGSLNVGCDPNKGHTSVR